MMIEIIRDKSMDLVLWAGRDRKTVYWSAVVYSLFILALTLQLGRPDRGGCLLVFTALFVASIQTVIKDITEIVRTSTTTKNTPEDRRAVVELFNNGARVLLIVELLMAMSGTLIWGFG